MIKKKLFILIFTIIFISLIIPITVQATETVEVSTAQALEENLLDENNSPKEDITVILTNDIELNHTLNLFDAKNVIIDLNGHYIKGSDNFENNSLDLIFIAQCNNVTIKNGTIVTSQKVNRALYVEFGAILQNLSIDHTLNSGGPAIATNELTLVGNICLTLGENSTAGLYKNAEGDGSEKIDFSNVTKFEVKGNKDVPIIKLEVPDDDSSIIGADKVGIEKSSELTYTLSEKTDDDITTGNDNNNNDNNDTNNNSGNVANNNNSINDNSDEINENNNNKGEKDKTPKTGSVNVIFILTIIGLVSLMEIIIVKKYNK